MSLQHIIAGDYGNEIKITFLDVDTGQAADISGYTTTKTMLFRNPAGESVSKTAVFDTDGEDGVIKYTVEASFLTAGTWYVRGRVASGSAVLSTEWHTFLVAA